MKNFKFKLKQIVTRKEKLVIIVGRAEYIEQDEQRYMVQDKRDFDRQGLNFYNTSWVIESELTLPENEKST